MEATEVSIRRVRSVGPDAVALDLATPPGFDALPGQFVLVRATVDGEEHARHYTISSPDVEDTFEVTVGVDPEGTLSPWLADRDPGDHLAIEGPFGTIAYDATADGDVVVLAAGPGVGPAVGVAEAAVGAGHDAAVVYEGTEPAHRDRLDGLADGGALVTVVDRDGLAGAVAGVADAGQVYVFGFRDFCERSRDALAAAGVDPEEAQVENFG